jgi:tetratricopeptide (TPR) repeat protein
MKTFDLAISFAGEDRKIAKSLASTLKKMGLLVFYDDDEQANLLGECLTEYLTDIYKEKSGYCVVLVSRHYVLKRWTRLEWKAAQARAFEEFDTAYILPIRLDSTELPGLLSTIGYLSIKDKSIQEISKIIHQKVVGLAIVNRAVRKADEAFRLGQFQSVIDLLGEPEIFEHLGKDRASLRLLCDAYMAIGSYNEAISGFQLILRNVDNDAESYFLAGVCLCRLRRYDEAIPYLENAVELAPHHKTALNNLRAAKRQVGRQKKAT